MNITLYFSQSSVQLVDSKTYKAENEMVNTENTVVNAKQDVKKLLNNFLQLETSKKFRCLCYDVNDVLNEIKTHLHYIEAAGGFIEKNGLYLFIRRLGVWDLPKGKLEKKEAPEQGAVRECEEECGIKQLHIIKPLEPTWHIYPYKGDFALKKTFWYHISTQYNETLTPQVEEDITEVKWFTKSEVIDKVYSDTYFTILDVIKEALKN